MPLYEYACKRCGNRFEVRQKFSEEPLKIHEECGGDAERVLSVPAFQFKGTGWYVTDYAKSGAKSPESGATDKKSEGKDAKSEGKGESKSESKSDSKSESKSESSPAPKTETKSTSESKPS